MACTQFDECSCRLKKYGTTGGPVGVLLAQLGTPEAPTGKALRPYLRQFLSDPRVIEANRFVWWCVLNGIVLVTRPKRSARLYKRIWTEEGSPLMVISKKQRELVQERFAGENVIVELGMRYGEPSLERAAASLIKQGCRHIVLVPMYPQYSAATTASTYDAVFPALLKTRWVPTLQVVAPYFDNPAYVRACAAVIEDGLSKLNFEPEKLVLSYHGIPAAYVGRGDPYCCHCHETTRHLAAELKGIDPSRMIHTFQSRFGKDPWLEPYTDETIKELAEKGVKRIALFSPGFTADCLETLDELGNEGRMLFQEHGGTDFALLPGLNDHPAWIGALTELIRAHIRPEKIGLNPQQLQAPRRAATAT